MDSTSHPHSILCYFQLSCLIKIMIVSSTRTLSSSFSFFLTFLLFLLFSLFFFFFCSHFSSFSFVLNFLRFFETIFCSTFQTIFLLFETIFVQLLGEILFNFSDDRFVIFDTRREENAIKDITNTTSNGITSDF